MLLTVPFSRGQAAKFPTRTTRSTQYSLSVRSHSLRATATITRTRYQISLTFPSHSGSVIFPPCITQAQRSGRGKSLRQSTTGAIARSRTYITLPVFLLSCLWSDRTEKNWSEALQKKRKKGQTKSLQRKPLLASLPPETYRILGKQAHFPLCRDRVVRPVHSPYSFGSACYVCAFCVEWTAYQAHIALPRRLSHNFQTAALVLLLVRSTFCFRLHD